MEQGSKIQDDEVNDIEFKREPETIMTENEFYQLIT